MVILVWGTKLSKHSQRSYSFRFSQEAARMRIKLFCLDTITWSWLLCLQTVTLWHWWPETLEILEHGQGISVVPFSAESVMCWLPVWTIVSSKHIRVKPMTYKIDICHHQAWCSVLIGSGNDGFGQYQDNVTAHEIKSCGQRLGLPVGKNYEVAMSVHCHKSAPVLIWPWCWQGVKLQETSTYSWYDLLETPWHY